MRKPMRLLAAFAATVLSAMVLFASPASAGKPVEIGQCVVTINVPREGAIEIPICWSGPPL